VNPYFITSSVALAVAAAIVLSLFSLPKPTVAPQCSDCDFVLEGTHSLIIAGGRAYLVRGAALAPSAVVAEYAWAYTPQGPRNVTCPDRIWVSVRGGIAYADCQPFSAAPQWRYNGTTGYDYGNVSRCYYDSGTYVRFHRGASPSPLPDYVTSYQREYYVCLEWDPEGTRICIRGAWVHEFRISYDVLKRWYVYPSDETEVVLKTNGYYTSICVDTNGDYAPDKEYIFLYLFRPDSGGSCGVYVLEVTSICFNAIVGYISTMGSMECFMRTNNDPRIVTHVYYYGWDEHSPFDRPRTYVHRIPGRAVRITAVEISSYLHYVSLGDIKMCTYKYYFRVK